MEREETGTAGEHRRPYLLAEWSGGGGLGHYAYLLAEALAAEGVDVTHVTRAGHELSALPRHHSESRAWPAAPGIPRGRRRTLIVGLGRLGGWFRFGRLLVSRRTTRPTVHLQTIDHVAEATFALFARALGSRVLVTVHNMRPHDARPLHALMQRVGVRIPHAIIVHTDRAADELRGSVGRGATIAVLGHPSYRRLAELVDRPAPPPRAAPRIGAIGMIRPYKGLEFVVEAFRAVRTSGLPCELRIAGRASDDDWVRSLVADLPGDAVSCRLGYLALPDFLDELLGCDVVLLGHRSLSESGVAQLALGAGVPVVGPRMGALARLLGGRPEWLYAPGDAEDAARCVRAVVAEAGGDRGTLRAQALALADAAPSWTEMARMCAALGDAPRDGHR